MLVRCFRKCASQETLRIGRYGLSLLVLAIASASPASASILWDGEAGTQWWFAPQNWNAASNVNTVLPPSNNVAGTSSTDTQINLGTGAWNMGEGVVFDPANDPNFAAAAAITFPAGFGRQIINGLFMSRGTTESTLLTIRGDLTFRDPVHVGSASGVRGSATNAAIVQESGLVNIPLDDLILATINLSSTGRGNGTYDYRGGTLQVGQDGSNRLILSRGSNSNAADGQKAGPGGVGKFIVHNPDTPGHIRVFSLTTAEFAGFDEGIQNNPNDSVFNEAFDANGATTGVGIFEFHYANDGTRPVQVNSDMILNNGLDNNTKGTRSSRLDLVLDEAPCDAAGCVPGNIGLFDVGFDGGGSLLGSGDLGPGDGNFTNDRVFSSLDGTTHYREGEVVSAMFGSTRYEWRISYTGKINWSNANNSEISSITGMGTGNDIVLIGQSTGGLPGDFDDDGDVDGRDFLAWQRGQSTNPLSAEDLADWQGNYGMAPLASASAIPEPSALILLCAGVLPMCAGRR
jgi:hypothetical protein